MAKCCVNLYDICHTLELGIRAILNVGKMRGVIPTDAITSHYNVLIGLFDMIRVVVNLLVIGTRSDPTNFRR